MCYAIPGKIIEVEDKVAIVDYFGERRRVLNELGIKVGDYAYAQGGFLVKKIPKGEARSILKTWKELFFKLKEVDLRISNVGDRPRVTDKDFTRIIEKAERNLPLKEEEILRLLRTTDKGELDLLFKIANAFRQTHLKNSCCVHGIIEFSNYCKNDCFYCGIRADNKNLERYRMSVDEIVDAADFAVNKLGFKALVLQSGEDFWYTTEKLVEIIKRIRNRCGALLFMSVGERSPDSYKKMYKAGARGVLLRFETSNPELFKRLHKGKNRKNLGRRIKILKYAYKLGYLIATGSLIGLPGQTDEDLMEDILLTKSLKAEMWSFGPLIPHPETPLARANLVNINRVLKVLAVSRLVNPEAKILVTTALETLDKEEGRKLGLLAGANSLMINATPAKYKNLYSIYPNKAGINKEVEVSIKETLDLLYSLGRAPTDLGISKLTN